MSKASVLAEIDELLEAEIGRNIHVSDRSDSASPDHWNATAGDLGMLFRWTTERATQEIENLIDQLQSLRMKLEADSGLIEQAFAEHSRFSQGAMQLTTMFADKCEKTSASSLIIPMHRDRVV